MSCQLRGLLVWYLWLSAAALCKGAEVFFVSIYLSIYLVWWLCSRLCRRCAFASGDQCCLGSCPSGRGATNRAIPQQNSRNSEQASSHLRNITIDESTHGHRPAPPPQHSQRQSPAAARTIARARGISYPRGPPGATVSSWRSSPPRWVPPATETDRRRWTAASTPGRRVCPKSLPSRGRRQPRPRPGAGLGAGLQRRVRWRLPKRCSGEGLRWRAAWRRRWARKPCCCGPSCLPRERRLDLTWRTFCFHKYLQFSQISCVSTNIFCFHKYLPNFLCSIRVGAWFTPSINGHGSFWACSKNRSLWLVHPGRYNPRGR